MTAITSARLRPAIVGHRGATGLAPENTLPSIRRAVELGVEWVEVDVRLTADGHPVLLHDERLDRTTTGAGPVSEWTLERLGAVDIRCTAGGAADAAGAVAPGVHVPTLAEALAALGPRAGCLIELKRDDEHEAALVTAVVAVVQAAGLAARVRLISFQESLLAECLRQAPELPRGIIGGRDLDELFALARRLGCVAVHPSLRLVAEDTAARCVGAGLRLNAWTANDVDEIRRLAALRVEEITTDYPNLAREVLGTFGGTESHSPLAGQ
jgi:glycerophosphoryl diester phosphodiesterase